MPAREMRPLNLSIGASLLPSFSLVTAAAGQGNIRAAEASRDCFGKVCHVVDEYCSHFAESCMPCAGICNVTSHNYQADMCVQECSAFNKYELLNSELHSIKSTQNLILLLLSILLIMIAIRYLLKCLSWLRHKRCIQKLLSRLLSKPYQSNANGKDLNATTIQNFNAINRDIERAPSQIYSVADAEGSVVTMATPVSTRYPAENSTTPTTVVTEVGYNYGYDNQAMVVTPVAEKPGTNAPPAF
ncbi:protein grindelwald [Drosophila sulfurigaster albostrigata]|uniref:Protein grindelwald n=1 Tax=Drosophila albomicans TaxID=7291 RepID=A0A6P8W4Z2_DROAB|nr:protein grindelwald [Drosophila albomicans]XP_062143165.1 protein grindelwald [Drosophila sulfurigaster albostrigata]